MDDLVKQVEALNVQPTRLSRETHLREWYSDVQRGVHPNEARGKSVTPRYCSLMNLRKLEDCPYNDDERELKEAWEALKRFFPPVKQTDAYYLKEFGRLYTETQDFKTACGNYTTYRFTSLKNIVDNDLEVAPELAGYKALLKSNWEYDSQRFTEKTAQEHLEEFFKEFDEHGDFMKARGGLRSARYASLRRIKNKPDEECNELELRLKEVWERCVTPYEHLEAFFKDFEVDNDFEEAFLKTKGRERALYYLMEHPKQTPLAVKFRQLCIQKEREEAEKAKEVEANEQDLEWTEEVHEDFEDFLQGILSRRLSAEF